MQICKKDKNFLTSNELVGIPAMSITAFSILTFSNNVHVLKREVFSLCHDCRMFPSTPRENVSEVQPISNNSRSIYGSTKQANKNYHDPNLENNNNIDKRKNFFQTMN